MPAVYHIEPIKAEAPLTREATNTLPAAAINFLNGIANMFGANDQAGRIIAKSYGLEIHDEKDAMKLIDSIITKIKSRANVNMDKLIKLVETYKNSGAFSPVATKGLAAKIKELEDKARQAQDALAVADSHLSNAGNSAMNISKYSIGERASSGDGKYLGKTDVMEDTREYAQKAADKYQQVAESIEKTVI